MISDKYKLLLLGALVFLACSLPGAGQPAATETPSPEVQEDTQVPSDTPVPPTDTPAPTNTATETLIPTVTETPTITPTPTETEPPTITPTPTWEAPLVTANVNAHCRYGPDTAYLHAADIYAGDTARLWNRNYDGDWAWVRFDKLHYACWIDASLITIDGDIMSVVPYFHPMPTSVLYQPVKNVWATRDGNQVTIQWEQVWMTLDDDRGYLIEAQLCLNGYIYQDAFHVMSKGILIVRDDELCEEESWARIYVAEKHGYTDFVWIEWPN